MKFEDWGILPYYESWERQKSICNKLINNPEDEGLVAFVEHPPVYTLGFHGDKNNLRISERELKSTGADLFRIERGGDITYHGPGQLVVYPLINLNKFGLGVKKYVHLLENSVIELLESYGIKASSNEKAIGVWLDWDTENARKICAIGIKVSHAVTMHGLSLNVNNDLTPFTKINPCGFTDKGVTSIAKELGHNVEMSEIIDVLKKILTAKMVLKEV